MSLNNRAFRKSLRFPGESPRLERIPANLKLQCETVSFL